MTATADPLLTIPVPDASAACEPPVGDDVPIEQHAPIGDCHGAALVTQSGSIDWAAIGRFDADPVFCRLLDRNRGGYWSIRPKGEFTSERAYRSDTNVLRTVFETSEGRVALLDCMPVGRKLDAGVHDYVHLNAPGWIVRWLEGLSGTVALELRYRPSKAFTRARDLAGRARAPGAACVRATRCRRSTVRWLLRSTATAHAPI